MPKLETPAAPPYTDFKHLVRKDFKKIAQQLTGLRKDKKEIEEQIKELDTKAQLLFAGLPEGVRSVQVEDIRVTLAKGRSPSRVDPMKLLSLGVENSIIKEATKEGKEYEYVKTTVKGDKEDEE